MVQSNKIVYEVIALQCQVKYVDDVIFMLIVRSLCCKGMAHKYRKASDKWVRVLKHQSGPKCETFCGPNLNILLPLKRIFSSRRNETKTNVSMYAIYVLSRGFQLYSHGQ